MELGYCGAGHTRASTLTPLSGTSGASGAGLSASVDDERDEFQGAYRAVLLFAILEMCF